MAPKWEEIACACPPLPGDTRGMPHQSTDYTRHGCFRLHFPPLSIGPPGKTLSAYPVWFLQKALGQPCWREHPFSGVDVSQILRPLLGWSPSPPAELVLAGAHRPRRPSPHLWSYHPPSQEHRMYSRRPDRRAHSSLPLPALSLPSHGSHQTACPAPNTSSDVGHYPIVDRM